MSSSLQIGTRGSVLALAQTDWVLGELRQAAPGHDMGRVIIETDGDRDQTSSLASFGGVGVFVAELQAAILDRRVDAAVHSFKDMASRPTLGLRQYFPERETSATCWFGALEDLPQGARVGTGSLGAGSRCAPPPPGSRYSAHSRQYHHAPVPAEHR